MHVADFESGALAGQTAWSKSRETALVRDLRQRVGLIHELRKLAGTEELADGGHHRLGVHQVVRHGRRHFLVHRHLFFDGALHAHQADAELVFEQLAHRANAAVAQVIDVVDRADTPAQLQQVLDGVDEVLLIERPLVERRGIDFVVQLDVELHAAHARKVVLARVEEHALEQLRGGVERRRIARTQLAVDFEQRVVLALDRILSQRDGNHVARVVALGEEHLERRDAVVHHLIDVGELLIGFHQHFAGGHVDHVGGDIGALQVGAIDFHLLDLGLENRFVKRLGDLAALRNDGFVLGRDGFGELQADQAVGNLPEQLLVLDGDFADVVERLQDFGVGLEPQSAQEHRAVEFSLAVDTDVQQVLVVVLEFDPASAIGNDLAEEITLCRNALEEHAGRAVQLRNDDALGSVDDEGAVVGHQRNFAEEDLLLLDVADRLDAGFGVLVVHREADGHLERSGVGHAALFALGDVVFQLQAHWIAATVAERDDILVERSAAMAQHVADMERIGLDGGAAAGIAAGGTQVMQPFQIAALALPVSDRIIHELQLA